MARLLTAVSMTRPIIPALLLAGATLTLTASAPPSPFAEAQPGMWEVSGVPGASAPVRQCVADLVVLARFEHRARNCSAKIVRDQETSSEIDYSCGSAGFGHSEVNVITPRSLRIATQGISGGLPFNYVLQARRIGECTASNRH